MRQKTSVTRGIWLAAALAVLAAAGAAAAPAPEGDQAGVFDYYVLSLSWSPTYCAELEPGRREPQCDAAKGRRYAFVLHGLWPQFEEGWPESCATADKGFVPRATANRMLDIMPSDKLVFHQYRKHGTCSGLGVDGYFATARQFFEKVKIPPAFRNPADPRFMISPADVKTQFIAANAGLETDQVAVTCGGTGPRLREVRICFTKTGAFRACGGNESPARQCKAGNVYVPPVRPSP